MGADMVLAEREGFEPPVRLPVLRISSATHSTTLPPLRGSKRELRWSREALPRRGRGFNHHCWAAGRAKAIQQGIRAHIQASARNRHCRSLRRRARARQGGKNGELYQIIDLSIFLTRAPAGPEISNGVSAPRAPALSGENRTGTLALAKKSGVRVRLARILLDGALHGI